MGPYVQALRQTVKPGSVVLDLGAGTGIFAFLACQMGAERVYAIEPGACIQVARQMAQANGYADRIEFIQQLSTEVTLPQPVDVIISDLRGILPLFQTHIPALADARHRFLAPGGVLIPQQDRLWGAIVTAPEVYDPLVQPWENRYGLDMNAARQVITHAWYKANLNGTHCLTEPQLWGELDYRNLEQPDLAGPLTWTLTRSGTAHGLCLWFETTLLEGIGFSNAPDQPPLLYGQAFFPWPTPVQLAIGDRVEVTLRANLVRNDYIWRWQTQVLAQETVTAQFNQSTFQSHPLALAELHLQADSHQPALSLKGQVMHHILGWMDGDTALGEITQKALVAFPDYFAAWQDAFDLVAQVSRLYSRPA
ncbi:50S ribosomal protein L11 methyltransferase [Leptolyngbya sp. 'hensonii']|uniref:50S ribosomal protein L11 methyltransferase n=1 Tax=Leptolyngbya sp. 'hensonii' TaxID=1922337 RepID=UPI0015C57CAB|nr:50S ribosomal protein L11 methyltransferase [Leptolyngbya sp. 'hensonii']